MKNISATIHAFDNDNQTRTERIKVNWTNKMQTGNRTPSGTKEDVAQTTPNHTGFTMRTGNTTIIVELHFSKTSKETLEDKVKRLVKNEAISGNA